MLEILVGFDNVRTTLPDKTVFDSSVGGPRRIIGFNGSNDRFDWEIFLRFMEGKRRKEWLQ